MFRSRWARYWFLLLFASGLDLPTAAGQKPAVPRLIPPRNPAQTQQPPGAAPQNTPAQNTPVQKPGVQKPNIKPPSVPRAGQPAPRRMNPTARVTPRERAVLKAARSGKRRPAADGVAQPADVWYVVHNVEFKDADSCGKFDVDGVTVSNRFDRFADVFIVDTNDDAVDKIVAAIHAVDGFLWEEFAGSVHAPPPPVGTKTTSRAVPEAIVTGGVGDLKGKGVIIAVIDTGLDFSNPDFVTYDKDGKPTSRLRYFWDTTAEFQNANGLGAPAPFTYPNGAPIGTIYSRDDLNKALRSPKPLITVWDIDGHGTSCAGVAAGNGNNLDGRYQGVAPEAELIGVRLGDNLESCYLLNGICGWIDKVAGATPVVMSCSFGGEAGGHDGLRIEERQLDVRFPLTTKGRAVCIAAGNDGGNGMHADLSFSDQQNSATLKWNSPTQGYLSVFYDTDQDGDLRYVPAEGLDLTETGSLNPLSGKYVSYFTVPPGKGQVQFYTQSGAKVSADAYLTGYSSDDPGTFDDSCATYDKLIETPGSTHNAITVGSYDWNDQFEQHGQLAAMTDPLKGQPLTIGALSGYSSTGPLRDSNVVKPDIVSPGQYYSAAASRNTSVVRDTSSRYTLFNGTSAATPYTAGVLALVMQKKPTITLGEIKDLLRNCGSHDRFTGPVPNSKWGNGKLDLQAVEKILDSLKN